MKKKIAVIALIAMIAVMAISLVACSNATGTYKFESMEMSMGGMSVKLEAGKEVDFMGQKVTVNADAMTLELKSDKTYEVKGGIMGQEMNETGKWEEKDGKIILEMDDEKVEATLKDGILTFKMDMEGQSVTISFKK